MPARNIQDNIKVISSLCGPQADLIGTTEEITQSSIEMNQETKTFSTQEVDTPATQVPLRRSKTQKTCRNVNVVNSVNI